MDNQYSSFMDRPTSYRIQVYGFVSERWISSYWEFTGMDVQHGTGITVTDMMGEVSDQAALIDLLNTLYNLGHAIIYVKRQVSDRMNEKTTE